MEITSNSGEVTCSASNELSQSGVCPLPSFLPSRLSDNMVTSTQKEQVNTQPTADSWRNENYSCDSEPLLNTASTQQLSVNCDQKPEESHLGNLEGVKENILAVRHILLKLLGLPDNKQILKRLGYISDVLDTMTFFIKFASRFEVIGDSQFSKTDSDYLGDNSNLSSLYLNHLISGFKKSHQKVVGLRNRSFESNVFSQGDSFESGNFVYAPKGDNLYGPAEVQNSAVTSTSREKEMCDVKFLKTISPGSEAVTEEEIISVHCHSIYNHERLPVNAKVLVKPTADGTQADESHETVFRKATIVEVFEKKSRSKQSSYAYLVQFLDDGESQRVNHDQVLIEKAELERLSKVKRSQPPLNKQESSPTRFVNECFRQLSLDSKVTDITRPKDSTQRSKETNSLFKSKETPSKASIKRHLSEIVSSSSTYPEPGPSAAKKVQKEKTDVTLGSFENVDMFIDASPDLFFSVGAFHIAIFWLQSKLRSLGSLIFSGVHFVLTGFKPLGAEVGSCQSLAQRESFSGETLRDRRDSNEIGITEEIAEKETKDEESQEDENGDDKSEMTESRLKELIEENGGKICETVEKMKTFTNSGEIFLLAPKALTSPKYLAALALDIPCLSGKHFISTCIIKGKLFSSKIAIDNYRLPAGWGCDGDQWSMVEWAQCAPLSSGDKRTRKDLFSQRKIYLPLCSETAHLSTVLTFTRAKVVPLNRQRCTTRSSEIDESSFQNSFAIIGQNFRFSDDVHTILEKFEVPILKARYISQCLIHGKELPFLDFLVD